MKIKKIKIMTAMQDLIEFATLSSMQYPISEIVAKAHQLLEKEKQQLISMCNIGSTNPGIKGEDVYNQMNNKTNG